MKAVLRNVGRLVSGDIRGPILDAAVVIGAKGSTAIPGLIDSR
jgi:imidazolonepropionase-like amidohydrolase